MLAAFPSVVRSLQSVDFAFVRSSFYTRVRARSSLGGAVSPLVCGGAKLTDDACLDVGLALAYDQLSVLLMRVCVVSCTLTDVVFDAPTR